MVINIEIGKSWQSKKWNIRIGDIDGCTEISNISRKELMEEIREQLKIELKLKEENEN